MGVLLVTGWASSENVYGLAVVQRYASGGLPRSNGEGYD